MKIGFLGEGRGGLVCALGVFPVSKARDIAARSTAWFPDRGQGVRLGRVIS